MHTKKCINRRGNCKDFGKEHPKADVFNEALNTARVEATGLDIPKVKQVTQIDGRWSLVIECKEGKTLEEMMNVDPANLEKYMEDFVDLQLQVQSKRNPLLNKLKDKACTADQRTEGSGCDSKI